MAFIPATIGFSLLNEDNELLDRFVGNVLKTGKILNGYSMTYINQHYGQAQFIASLVDTEKGPETVCFDTHADSPNVWNLQVLDRDTAPHIPGFAPCYTATDTSGSRKVFPIHIMNADVLPCMRNREMVRLQMVGLSNVYHISADRLAACEYYKDRAENLLLENDEDGMHCVMMPHPETGEPVLSPWVFLTGTIREVLPGIVKLPQETGQMKCFTSIVTDTQFGELKIDLDEDSLDDAQAACLKPGCYFVGRVWLSGDPAIFIYEHGMVMNKKNNLSLVRDIFCGGDPERLRPVITDSTVYVTADTEEVYTGEEIIERMKYVQETTKLKIRAEYAQFRKIEVPEDAQDDASVPDIRPFSSILALYSYKDNPDEEGCYAIGYVETNKEGYIEKIRTYNRYPCVFKCISPVEYAGTGTTKAYGSISDSILYRLASRSIIDESVRPEDITWPNEETEARECAKIEELVDSLYTIKDEANEARHLGAFIQCFPARLDDFDLLGQGFYEDYHFHVDRRGYAEEFLRTRETETLKFIMKLALYINAKEEP